MRIIKIIISKNLIYKEIYQNNFKALKFKYEGI